MSSFFQNLGLAYGNSLIVGQEMADKQANIDVKQQQVAQYKMANAAKAQEVETTKQIGQFIATEQGADRATVEDPVKQAQTFTKASNLALTKGSWDMAGKLSDLAKGSYDTAKAATAAVEGKIQAAQEALATAAFDFQGFPSPEGAAAVAKAAVAAGVNPTSIPLPHTKEFPLWAKAQQTAAQSSKDRVTQQEKIRQFEVEEERRKTEFQEKEEGKREARAALAASREGTEEYRRDVLDIKRDALKDAKNRKAADNDFKQAEKLNAGAQKEAAPYIKDREVVSTVKNLLHVDSAVADQQIQQALPSLMGSLKGRATNPYYKDNKYYGSMVDKLTDLASRTISGRYSEDTRQQIFYMLDQMEKQQLDPTITRIEQQQKSHAKKYGLDPSLIEIKGDFNRLGADGKPLAEPKAESSPAAESRGKTSAGNTNGALPAMGSRERLEGDIAGLKREIKRADKSQMEILGPELRKAEAELAAMPTATAAAPAASAKSGGGATGSWALPAGVTQSKTLNGVTYYKKGDQWLTQ